MADIYMTDEDARLKLLHAKCILTTVVLIQTIFKKKYSDTSIKPYGVTISKRNRSYVLAQEHLNTSASAGSANVSPYFT